ncbi:Do family serine endopeptidase [Estrella lausannensis]|uniref:Periplasmic serine endoprotease DegP-like n=1 Tax=Estrella lausannensis TaxID=483423 RepID=A0A0H5DTH6_9BACT|nr:Do family serine endopeptidase [Estrella lausannensis]CRX39154.1 Putative serine protease do-like [Estrella lausannensis]
MTLRSMLLMFITSLTLVHGTPAAERSESYRDFTFVAEKAIPAVVSIQVKSTGGSKGRALAEDTDPFSDLYQDELFSKLFGGRRLLPKEPQESTAQASGFLISKEGLILTNNHVVTGAKAITVTLNDGRELNAKLVGQDPNTDLAIIKIDAENLPYLEMGNSDELRVGQWVIAIGNPLGLQASLTVGVVSAKGRSNLDLARIEDFIQTDAAINRGNSGGPLLNMSGEVVGINTAIVSNLASGGYMGIGFAIPSNIAHYVVSEIEKSGEVSRGFLGVALQPLDKDLANAFGLEKADGALIAEVQRNGAAFSAGIRQGDIILGINKKKIAGIGQLRNAVAMMKPGDKVTLEIMREGKKMDVPVTLGTLAKVGQKPAVHVSKIGIEVAALNDEIKEKLKIESAGVMVKKVDSESLAYIAGIREGALILSVNQKKVETPEEFDRIVAETESGKPLLFLIRQGESMRFVSIRER